MSITRQMQEHLDNLTKPVGSLGRLEEFALRMAEIQGNVPPQITRKSVFVFAGDHGVNEAGVSMYPQEVTYQMLRNFTQEGAGINVLARHCGFDVRLIDVGIAREIDFPGVISRKAGWGTKNFHQKPAMDSRELASCLETGRELAEAAALEGCSIAAVGDMGISNTTAASAMVIAAGLDGADIIDRGTGITEEILERKRTVILESVKRRGPFSGPEDILMKVGGFEEAAMAGFILGLKDRGVACVIDGFPVTAGAYMAWLMDREVSSFLFAGHQSKVKGHRVILDAMGLEPIVDFGMRLGEGTGAVIGGFMIDLGVRISREMASFADAQVSTSTGEEENY